MEVRLYQLLSKVLKILKTPMNCWPSSQFEKRGSEIEENDELVRYVNATVIENPVINANKINDWEKLLRITAYVFRGLKAAPKRVQHAD